MEKKRKPAPIEEQASSEGEQLKIEEPFDESEEESDDDSHEENGEESSSEEEEESDEEESEESDEEESEKGEEEAESESGEEEDQASKREIIRKLLEPFEKDQLIEIYKEVALKDSSIIARISQSAESDPHHRKIFIHGFGSEASNETIISTFKQYGELEECNVVTDKITGKSKGYGFLLFKTGAGARKALKKPQKIIGNRMIACQFASFGPVPNHPVPDPIGRKILVANVGAYFNPDKLRAFFANFGEIDEGPLGYDQVTGKFKGFAIFVYRTTDGCKKALEEPIKMFQGCQLQCQRAIEGLQTNKIDTGLEAGLGANEQALTCATSLNPGMVSQNINSAAPVGQNVGIGVQNPVLETSLNQVGLTPPVASGLSSSVDRSGTTSPLGLSAGFGGQPGINGISPSVIGSGSHGALQGLGAYESSLGQSSALEAAESRSQSGIGSIGTLPSFYRR
ncbi:hypothetical protein HHK36_017895 [Tetracentron sinense]|uniref:RRM domain-containing protein n=1 Tax=Tetracentron sinense TaxID=13715 RepID=A0A834YYP2_TETSI|nr:hypothetical protein HHK36_017895 [Tetracentron sinense]